MKKLLAFTFATLSLAAVACGGSDDRDPSGASADTEDELRRTGVVDVTQAQDGKTITVEKGKSVRLRLKANGSTGYKWAVTSTNRTFGYPSPKDGTYKAESDGPVGSGGVQEFVWKTSSPILEPGANVHKVELEYRRPWETNGEAAEKFSFSVKIKAAGESEEAEEPARSCPTSSTINCMPPTTNKYCKSDYRQWAQQNCDVSYLD